MTRQSQVSSFSYCTLLYFLDCCWLCNKYQRSFQSNVLSFKTASTYYLSPLHHHNHHHHNHHNVLFTPCNACGLMISLSLAVTMTSSQDHHLTFSPLTLTPFCPSVVTHVTKTFQYNIFLRALIIAFVAVVIAVGRQQGALNNELIKTRSFSNFTVDSDGDIFTHCCSN